MNVKKTRTPEELKTLRTEQAAKARAKRTELMKDPEYKERLKQKLEAKKVDKFNNQHGGKALKDVVNENIKNQHELSRKMDDLNNKLFDLSVRVAPQVAPSDSMSTANVVDNNTDYSNANVIKSKKPRKVLEVPKVEDIEEVPKPKPSRKRKTMALPAEFSCSLKKSN